ncbi:arsenate reductase (glutaredoxin) [Salmonella enterica]|uniref:arsenate reductase (glutaredoxin) n=1 Tax=Salmonella enterica TaxID=28901 RepID=UPI0009B15DFD|nr:arsenate reductase (glutaredoxin) [Salmonella enterica]
MTDTIKIYHNPRCSKSRDTLNLLKSNGVEPEVVLYLDTPADAATVRELLRMLGMSSARELMRQKEDLYKTLHLADSERSILTPLSEEALIQALVEHPKLMERPIVVANGQARIGRPPEQVLDILG